MSKSKGEQYQCDCTALNSSGIVCACTDWFVIPAGKNVPSEARCPQCQMGRHK